MSWRATTCTVTTLCGLLRLIQLSYFKHKVWLLLTNNWSVRTWSRQRRRKQDEVECNGLLLIVKTVILCVCQNIVLWGHCDTGRVNLDVDYEHQEGNLKSLLHFRVRGGDDGLGNYIRMVPANALQTSLKIKMSLSTPAKNS